MSYLVRLSVVVAYLERATTSVRASALHSPQVGVSSGFQAWSHLGRFGPSVESPCPEGEHHGGSTDEDGGEPDFEVAERQAYFRPLSPDLGSWFLGACGRSRSRGPSALRAIYAGAVAPSRPEGDRSLVQFGQRVAFSGMSVKQAGHVLVAGECEAGKGGSGRSSRLAA